VTRFYALTGGAVTVGALSTATAPDVPWWGHLLMNLLAVALAFFGGAARVKRR
jgi:hypothetical protein